MAIFGTICLVLIVGAAVYYFGFYKQGKINDRDGDLIPDEIEDAAEEVKVRTRNKKGHYVADDKSTPDVNEAWTTKRVKKSKK